MRAQKSEQSGLHMSAAPVPDFAGVATPRRSAIEHEIVARWELLLLGAVCGRDRRATRLGDAALQAVPAGVRLDVPKEFERDEQPANGGAGKRGGAGDFGDAEGVRMGFEAGDYLKAASKGENEVGVAFVSGKLASPTGTERGKHLR
jgi:hypothetical protein